MKNPRSDAAPGASSSQGSGEAASWRMGGRDVTGVETARARTGEKKSKFESTPTSMDLGMTARDGSEQALRPINHEPEQGLGQIEGFDCWDDAMLKEEIDYFYKRYHALPANDDYEAWAPISDHQLQDMELRFAICRIKAHKMLKGEDLSVAELRNMYPPAMLEEEEHFRWVERDFEWYFDPKYCEFAHLEDYQRLALRDTYEYLDWEFYHKNCNTLQGDREYVYFWEKLSSKTKWIKNFRGAKPSERERFERVVFYHVVKIARECTNCFTPLLDNGYSEYLCSIRFDNTWYEDYASLYFDIWKLVAKQKMTFKDALDQVKEKGMHSLCHFELKIELDSDQPWLIGPVTKHYNTYVAEIKETVPEGDAYKMVMEAVKKLKNPRVIMIMPKRSWILQRKSV
ncbi:hypothetical protein PVAP13_9KG400518 [Panicum virgatum]|uniref:Uncharacterized protein n=1 Tax=Panicum virgatum TaxID=38727 RepID=A0A8T0NA28_PANVG|nr:hypothetical protein PVAP13_9KG400518 [Panicum virgatum]